MHSLQLNSLPPLDGRNWRQQLSAFGTECRRSTERKKKNNWD